MEKIFLKYRTYYQGMAPQPIKLQISGWAGNQNNHTDGDVPQPWHCVPFVEGSTYGLELLYAFNTECHVKIIDGELKFIGDFSQESNEIDKSLMPPFSCFAPGHFGMTSCLDIQVPDGYVLRIEPHPSYYTDETYTVPLAIPGHLNTAMWPKIFFVVFKNPMPNQTYVFKKGMPYAQILILPRKVQYEIQSMTSTEESARALLDSTIDKYCKQFVSNDWHDYKGNNFDDKYKVLNQIYAKGKSTGVQKFLQDVIDGLQQKPTNFQKLKLFFPRKK